MRILAVVNPRAANGKALRLVPMIKRQLSETPHEFLWRITETPEEMRSSIASAPSIGAEAILLVGGDGTVHQALPAVAAAKLPLGLFPCGRGNDFARNIGISSGQSTLILFRSEPFFREVDLPTVNAVPFGTIACLGFDAEVGRLAKNGRGYFGGTLDYGVCVVRALRTFRPVEVQIEVDDYRWEGRVMMVAIANGRSYGGGMRIAPDANMSDGRFDVCIIREMAKWELLRQFPEVFRGRHINHPAVIMRTGKNVRVISDERRDIFADGEYVGKTPAVASIGTQRIEVMLPFRLS